MVAKTPRFDPALFISQVNTELHNIRWTIISKPEEDADWHSHRKLEQARSVRIIINMLLGAMEMLSMKEVSQRFNEDTKKYYDNPGDDLDLYPQGNYRSPLDGVFFDIIEDYTKVICNINGARPKIFKADQMEVLRHMLDNIPGMLDTVKHIPSTEPRFAKAIFPFFKYAFHGAMGDGTVNFIRGKNKYYPDLSIRELRTCVEFKIADNEDEFKKGIKELSQDVDNYGNENYDRFIGVMYAMEKCNSTQKEFESAMLEEIKGKTRASSWSFILVKGPGQRKRGNKKHKTSNYLDIATHDSKDGLI